MYIYRYEPSIIYQKPSETIVSGGCEHIDNKCVKRYIPFFDYKDMVVKKLEICNEKLKLLTQKEFIENSKNDPLHYYRGNDDYKHAMIEVIYEIISNTYCDEYFHEVKFKTLSPSVERFFSNKFTFNPLISVILVLRPFVTTGIYYKDAIDLLYNNKNNKNINSLANDNPYGHLTSMVAKATKNILDYILKYVKYKKYHSGAKKITDYILYSNNIEIWLPELNEFMASLLGKYEK